jgi:hypothetical protein
LSQYRTSRSLALEGLYASFKSSFSYHEGQGLFVYINKMSIIKIQTCEESHLDQDLNL